MSQQPQSSSSSRDRRLVLIVSIAAAVVIAIAVIAGLWLGGVFGGDGDDAGAAPAGTAEVEGPVADGDAGADADADGGAAVDPAATPDYLIVGDPAAPVVVDVYIDYLCPYCSVFAADVEPHLESGVVESGEANVVYHDVAFVHPTGSQALAVGARAAGEQGFYAEFHAAAMNAQADIRAGGGEVDEQLLVELAESAGVPDIELFVSRLDAPELVAGLEASAAEAAEREVPHVPYVYVNGEAVEEPTLENVLAAIERAG